MDAGERLRGAIERGRDGLREGVPADRDGAALAVLWARDRLPDGHDGIEMSDPVTGRRLVDPGGNLALRLCLEAEDGGEGAWWESGGDPGKPVVAIGELEGWAEGFLDACGRLAEAEAVLGHVETGVLGLADGGNGGLDAWVATRRIPTVWRERADLDWWAAWSQSRTVAATEGEARVAAMAYQLGYPDEAVLGGCAVRTYRAVLGWLIGRALPGVERGEAATPVAEETLAAEAVSALGLDRSEVVRALDTFTLGREGAAYHAAVPGVAAAPLVRLGDGRLVASLRGLTTEPLLFLARELRRRDAEGYHATAALREEVFRRDLSGLFGDPRFVTSPGRIQLRREDASLRTDVDAVVFDRKTGTLGLFELKTQDPFARSSAERARQRDNVLYANRQVSGVLAWVNRHGADALLERVDRRAARTFRAQRVLPFVLGRYLARFDDGPEPDRRAAWGTWPEVLRALGGEPARGGDANPLATLFARLTNPPPRLDPANLTRRELDVGGERLVVHPSYAAYREAAGGERRRS